MTFIGAVISTGAAAATTVGGVIATAASAIGTTGSALLSSIGGAAGARAIADIAGGIIQGNIDRDAAMKSLDANKQALLDAMLRTEQAQKGAIDSLKTSLSDSNLNLDKAISGYEQQIQTGKQAQAGIQEVLSGNYDVSKDPMFKSNVRTLKNQLAFTGQSQSPETASAYLSPLIIETMSKRLSDLLPVASFGAQGQGMVSSLYGKKSDNAMNVGRNLADIETIFSGQKNELSLGVGSLEGQKPLIGREAVGSTLGKIVGTDWSKIFKGESASPLPSVGGLA